MKTSTLPLFVLCGCMCRLLESSQKETSRLAAQLAKAEAEATEDKTAVRFRDEAAKEEVADLKRRQKQWARERELLLVELEVRAQTERNAHSSHLLGGSCMCL